MVLLTFSFSGENSTGSQSFDLVNEYKFKNLYLEDVKYYICSSSVEESVNGNTASSGLGGITTTILSPLALKFDFLDTKDSVLYSLGDGDGETLNTAQNITGLVPIGRANKAGLTPSSMESSKSHSYPYKLISNRPQTWAVGKTLTFDLYYRDVNTAGLVKDWALMSGTTDAFGDVCSIDITLRLE